MKIFKVILPKLAERWFRQRGAVFGFGNFDPASPKLLFNFNRDLLENALINSMAAERQVGRINYGATKY